jgi:hypothetical protein
MKIWQRVQQRDAKYGAALLSLEFMAQELRQCQMETPVSFSGTAQEMSFLAVAAEGFVKVSYRFDTQESRLIRRSIPYAAILQEQEEPLLIKELEMPAEDVALSYLVQESDGDLLAWTDTVVDAGIKVFAVKCKANVGGQEIDKTIFLPL